MSQLELEEISVRFEGESVLGKRPHQILSRGIARTLHPTVHQHDGAGERDGGPALPFGAAMTGMMIFRPKGLIPAKRVGVRSEEKGGAGG